MWDRGKRSAVAGSRGPGGPAALDRLVGRRRRRAGRHHRSGRDLPRTCSPAGLAPGQPGVWIVHAAVPARRDAVGGRAASRRACCSPGSGTPGASRPTTTSRSTACSRSPCTCRASGPRPPRSRCWPGRRPGGRWRRWRWRAARTARQLVSPAASPPGRDEPHVHRPGGPGGTLPNYRCYRCADGQWLFLGAFTNAFIERGFRACRRRLAAGRPAGRRGPGRGAAAGRTSAGSPASWNRSSRPGRGPSGWPLLEAADVPARPPADEPGGLAGPRAGPGARAAGRGCATTPARTS